MKLQFLSYPNCTPIEGAIVEIWHCDAHGTYSGYPEVGLNQWELLGTVMISLSYLALVYLPIQVMQSGLSGTAFVEVNPMYMIPGFINVVGLILFGIAVISAKFFPAWTGAIIMSGSIIFIVAMTNGFQVVANINNITLSMTLIYMCVLGYMQLQKKAY